VLAGCYAASVHTPDATTIGQRLRRARLASGVSQVTLAARARVAAKTVSAIECGHVRQPYMATLRRLAAVLGVSARWLRDGDAHPPDAP
jgi:transcriptional regulator with XRE-family HTH domain